MPSNLAIQARGVEATGQTAFMRARRKPERMAYNLPDSHCLATPSCAFSWLNSRKKRIFM
eukprot:328616-Pelagomonas_calceolata.AAC.1